MYLDGSLKGLPESPTTTAHLAQVPLGTSRPPCMQEFQAGRETTSGTSRASGASTSISTNQSASSQTANSQTAGSQTAGSQAAGGQSGGNLAVPGSQAGLRPQPGRASAPTAVAAAQPSPSTKPKWAALLEPGGASMTQAAAPSPSAPPFPGLGKTQAGNLLASLANQSAGPGAAGSPAFGPTSPARVGYVCGALRGCAARGGRGARRAGSVGSSGASLGHPASRSRCFAGVYGSSGTCCSHICPGDGSGAERPSGDYRAGSGAYVTQRRKKAGNRLLPPTARPPTPRTAAPRTTGVLVLTRAVTTYCLRSPGPLCGYAPVFSCLRYSCLA